MESRNVMKKYRIHTDCDSGGEYHFAADKKKSV